MPSRPRIYFFLLSFLQTPSNVLPMQVDITGSSKVVESGNCTAPNWGRWQLGKAPELGEGGCPGLL